jgi:hypothetical protein
MKKVIAFSIFGENRKYLVGLLKNLELAKNFYPGWKVYVYYNKTVPIYFLEEYKKNENAEFFDMSDVELPGMVWRFFPKDDVELFICRDADSRISKREVEAVDEWLSSDKILHIMRDHPHHDYPILGGMWGIKLKDGMDIKKMVFEYFQNDKEDLYIRMKDMDFLRDVIYNNYIGNSLVHDSFYSKNSHSKPFPSPLENYNFVGEIFEEDDTRNYQYQEWFNKNEKR